ncbi:MAG: ATP-grasp domain-containing protein [Chlamydiales bacterium]|nr:ATP-grasp domain-containing protein [Chlamydiales bacterium]
MLDLGKTSLKVLLLSHIDEGAWMLPRLLARSGFLVDVITCSPLIKYSEYVQKCYVTNLKSLPLIALKELIHRYDWVICTDDSVLKEISRSDLSPEEKLRLLPVLDIAKLLHIYSRLGLAKIFYQYGISTPPFCVVNSLLEASFAAQEMGYPVLLKTDYSGGGTGIFECQSEVDICEAPKDFLKGSFLVQKKIIGRELDLSALYLEGNLIHFSYCEIQQTIHKFGPSRLRLYTPLNLVDKAVFDELAALGKALGAHGFVNISCMESDGKRFYFEADMRPNVWVEFSRFFGEDPSQRIANWFCKKDVLKYPVMNFQYMSPVILPYFLRLKRWELLINRYNVWSFIFFEDRRLVSKLLLKHVCPRINVSHIPIVKSFTPKKIKKKWLRLKAFFCV